MSEPLASLDVDFNVDLRGLRRDLDRASVFAKRTQSDWAKSFAKTGASFGKAFTNATRDITKTFANVSRVFAKTFANITANSLRSSVSMTRAFTGATANISRSMNTLASNVGRTMRTITATALKAAAAIAKAFEAAANGATGGRGILGGLFGIGSGIVKMILAPIKMMGGLLFSTLGSVFTGVLQGLGQALYGTIQNVIVKPILAAKDVIVDSIFNASDSQTLGRKFKAVFEDVTKDADAFAQSYAKKFGRSIDDVRNTMARFQDTLVPNGFSVSQSAGMSKTLTKLAGDLAVSEGRSPEEVADRLVSGMVGNHEALRLLGVTIVQTTLDAKLLAMGIAGGTEKATEQEKVLARLNIILERTRQAQGAAARGGDTFAVAFEGMNSMFKDLSATFGRMFLPAATKVAVFFRDMYARIKENITMFGDVDQWGEKLGAAFTNIINMVKPTVDALIDKFKEFRNQFSFIFDFIADGTVSWDAMKQSMVTVWTAFMTKAGEAWDKVKLYAGQGLAYISGGFAGLLGIGEDSIQGMMQSLFDNLGLFIDALRKELHGLAKSARLPGWERRQRDQMSQEDLRAVNRVMLDRSARGLGVPKRDRWGDAGDNTAENWGKAYDEWMENRKFKAPTAKIGGTGSGVLDRVIGGANAGLDAFNENMGLGSSADGIDLPTKGQGSSIADMINGRSSGDIRRQRAFAAEQRKRVLAQVDTEKLAFPGSEASKNLIVGDQSELDFQRNLGSKRFLTFKQREEFISHEDAKRLRSGSAEEQRLRRQLSGPKASDIRSIEQEKLWNSQSGKRRKLGLQGQSFASFSEQMKAAATAPDMGESFKKFASRPDAKMFIEAQGLDFQKKVMAGEDEAKARHAQVGEMDVATLRRERFKKRRMKFGQSFGKLGIDSASGVFDAMGMSRDEAKNKAMMRGESLKQFAQFLGHNVDATASTGKVDIANATDEMLQGITNETSGRMGRFGRKRRGGMGVGGAIARLMGGSTEFSSLEDIGHKIQSAIGGEKKEEPVVSAVDKLAEIAQKQLDFFKEARSSNASFQGDINSGLGMGLT